MISWTYFFTKARNILKTFIEKIFLDMFCSETFDRSQTGISKKEDSQLFES